MAEVGEGAVQLRASGERAVLVGYDGVAEREMDPRRLPLGAELTDALHEWAKVACAIRRSAGGEAGPGGLTAGSAGSAAAGSPVEGPGRRGGLAGGQVAGSAGEPAAGRPAGGSAEAGQAGGTGAEPAGGSADSAAVGPKRGLASGRGAGPASGPRVGTTRGSAADPAVNPSAAGKPPAVSSVAAAVVSRRGLQLAGQVAAAMGVSVSYVDPLSGDISTVDPPPGVRVARAARPVEPVPWLTGLTVSAASLVLVGFMMVTLAVTLAETYPLLALAGNVVVTAGLVPSLWLIYRQPIWRWVAYGAAAGIGLGWLALPFILL